MKGRMPENGLSHPWTSSLRRPASRDILSIHGHKKGTMAGHGALSRDDVELIEL
ncbi:MAG: hypothetical protein OQL16_03485 [Gammaproteobacteria bacterium]|nr:hypothetical protein [Gammaproteobacteria bacterium]